MRFVCCEFEMSCKTLCNAGDCYEEFYKESLGEWAKWAFRFGEKLPFMVEIACVSLEREKPRSEARNLGELSLRRFAAQVNVPVVTTTWVLWAPTCAPSCGEGSNFLKRLAF